MGESLSLGSVWSALSHTSWIQELAAAHFWSTVAKCMRVVLSATTLWLASQL